MDLESSGSSNSSSNLLFEMKEVCKITHDDFEYESPVKRKRLEFHPDDPFNTFKGEENSPKSEDDDPSRLAYQSPTKKKLVSSFHLSKVQIETELQDKLLRHKKMEEEALMLNEHIKKIHIEVEHTK